MQSTLTPCSTSFQVKEHQTMGNRRYHRRCGIERFGSSTCRVATISSELTKDRDDAILFLADALIGDLHECAETR